ncbi:MAG: trans-sulfuration enzyme family protein, partial [Planctomycetota bacterium]
IDLYGGTDRLLAHAATHRGLVVRAVDTSCLPRIAMAMTTRTRLVLVESPTNPLLRVTDLRASARLARDAGACLVVDNTMMSPYLQQPLEHGADVVVHSATKHLCGHSDVTAGALVTRDAALGEQLSFARNATGNALAPFEAWLLQRGMKTLALRLERAQSNAWRLAELLRGHPAVEAVYYPGLADHDGRQLHERQARGPGSVVSFTTGDRGRSARFIEQLRLFDVTVSFGGVGSAASLPCEMSHASIPEHVRRERHLPADLVRLAVGIEAPEDLEDDIRRSLARLHAAANGLQETSRRRELLHGRSPGGA